MPTSFSFVYLHWLTLKKYNFSLSTVNSTKMIIEFTNNSIINISNKFHIHKYIYFLNKYTTKNENKEKKNAIRREKKNFSTYCDFCIFIQL